jgi:hypothetical protein
MLPPSAYSNLFPQLPCHSIYRDDDHHHHHRDDNDDGVGARVGGGDDDKPLLVTQALTQSTQLFPTASIVWT